LRIAWSSTFAGYPVDREVREVTAEAATVFQTMTHSVEDDAPAGAGSVYETFMPLYLADEYVGFDHLLSRRPSDLDPDTRTELANARRVTLAEYLHALHSLWKFRQAVSDFFTTYDLFVTPTNPVCAFPALEPPATIDGQPVATDWTTHLAFLAPWNLGGNPWITVPAGTSSEGLPIGLLLVAAVGREDLLFRAAAAFEEARPWAARVPDLAL
jgi:Asp-tRNA(Asn)/Glu-tRNA(Gln) amidotransferase A subunit family amidase